MRVLLVEDEAALAQRLAVSLRAAGYTVDVACDGRRAWELGGVEPYDAIVLDLGLPQLDGLTVLQRWRAEGVAAPVLILTARDAWQDKVAGIDAGADDYLTKPFHTEELLARLRALIRRAHGAAHPVLRCGALELDTRQQRASVAGQPLGLTAQELRVLTVLMHRAGQVVSRDELMEQLYGLGGERDSNTIEVFVARLRRKLPPGSIQTVRGLGYRLEAAVA
ncbi:Virulence transcriptional regulatory protein PhoP [Tepidimonas alkaliphilus]|uniref:Virulence transcriptional regulatory protein PhoP n=1 Tax=Tepidimonas alkaliphilus TaxID=2588942 RepID=A0A554WBK1_9BURK|nr:response regulator transcription factor [Tepidimonas alkaliphilus]TSE20958.1 Virulence transcriptional regulatory protein PhoP [Tepidimonas alkaliphilus]